MPGIPANGAKYYQYHDAGIVYVKDHEKRTPYLSKAVADYESALGFPLTTSYKYDAFYGLGTIKGDLGDFQNVVVYLNEAIRIDSTSADIFFKRGCARNLLKDYPGALADYNKAIELNPKDSEAIRNRNMILRNKSITLP